MAIKKAIRTWDVYWSLTGQCIATVQATDARQACRRAPHPYRRYLGELYAVPSSTAKEGL